MQDLRGKRPIVTTFKDFPRLSEGWTDLLQDEVWVLLVGMKIVKGKKAWENVLFG